MSQGNIAVDLQRRKGMFDYKARDTKAKKTTVKQGMAFTEKLFYLALVVILVVVSGFIVSRYALISQYNYEIQKTSTKIESLRETNQALQIKIDELSSPERIKRIAKEELGMTAREGSVQIYSQTP